MTAYVQNHLATLTIITACLPSLPMTVVSIWNVNAHVGHFNRMVQESFVDDHENSLSGNPEACTRALTDQLAFDNTQRPRHTLQMLPPLQDPAQHHSECHVLDRHGHLRSSIE